ncbi:MAG: PGF-pre-PGF domain-containing protein, partial [Halolamina sp.]
DGTTDGSGTDNSTTDGGSTTPTADLNAEPATANTMSTHRIAAGVGSVDDGSTLEAIAIEYPVGQRGADLGDVGLNGISVGVDTDGDGVTDTSLTDDLAAVRINTDGRLLLVFDGDYTLAAGDTVRIAVEDVRNPAAGDHDVAVEINPGATDSAVTTRLSTTARGATADSAVEDAVFVADPPAAGMNATHTARVTLAEPLTLDRVTVGYPGAVGLDGVNESALIRFGVDADGDGEIDRSLRSVVGSVTVSDGAVTVDLRDARALDAGETLIIALEDVQNPAIGAHSATVRLNDRPAASVQMAIGSVNARTATFRTDNGSQTIVQYPADETVTVDLRDLKRNGVRLVWVRVRPANDTTQLVVGSGDRTYESVDARGRQLAQLPVEHNGVAIETATVVFEVAKSRLNGTGYGPRNVSLYYREDGNWTRAETELVGETADSYRFAASAVSLSTYAVRLEPPNPRQQPAIGVGNVSLSQTTVEAGNSTTVTVVVRNDGEAPGTRTFSLTVNGVVLADATVSLAPNESTTLTFEHAFSRAGTYEVGVGGESVSVRVRATNATAATQASTTRSNVPGFGALAALVAVVLAAGLLLVGRVHQ